MSKNETLAGIPRADGGINARNINGGPLGGFRNTIINGDFPIWQRGTSLNGGGYLADRWTFNTAGTGTISQQRISFVIGDNSVPGNPTHAIRLDIGTAFTSCNLTQRLEDVRTLAGKTATLTYYARASVAGKTITSALTQVFGTGGSANVVTTGEEKVLSTQFQKFTELVSIPPIGGKTAGANSYLSLALALGTQVGVFDIAHVSLVEGDATAEVDPFSSRHIQQELALCQRYYQRVQFRLRGYQVAGAFLSNSKQLPVVMRTTPTAVRDETSISAINMSTLGIEDLSNSRVAGIGTINATGTGAATYEYTLDAEL